MENKKFYITTPIYYPSDKLHIGHSYTTVAADSIARYRRMQGYDVMFLTGSDEHGQKIADKAAAVGKTPKQYVDDIVATIKDLWSLMNISYDRYIRTTDDYHMESVQKIFRRLYNQGDIYKGKYEGLYCKPCESFWTESQLVDGKCPDCGREVVKAEEEAYFFKLSKYADRLLKNFEDNPEFLQPQSRVNEMVAFINQGLQDLCVSRTSFDWGVPVDFDPGHVVYVWVDALSNYINALGYENSAYNDFEKYWPADVHLMSKEIVRFHTIIWPAMLMALDLPLPKKVFSHGWLLLDGGKMSKSSGNVVDPVLLCERYGVDAVRYYLMRDIPFGHDANFSNEIMINRINVDLANALGNLLSRTVSMIDKYFGGKLPLDREPAELDEELINVCKGIPAKYEECMDTFQLPNALAEVFKAVNRANKYIDETEPWVLGKDESKKARLATVMYNLTETLRIVSIFLAPFMPSTPAKIQDAIGCPEDQRTYESGLVWGGMPADFQVTKCAPIFPRIDVAKELEELEAAKAAKAAEKAKAEMKPVIEHEPTIEFPDFVKCEMRVCEIKACENVKKSDKLLKFTMFDGERERTILSGVAKWYKAEEMVGKKVVCILNLAPRKMMGQTSEGMMLSSELPDGSASVLFVDSSVPAGCRIG